MSKDLVEVKNNMPTFLQNKQESVEEFTSGLTGGMPLPTISIRGKEFRLRKDGQEVSTRQRDLEVIFVAARTGISKRFYKDAYSSGETLAPDCSSADGVTPDVTDPVHDNCKNCPNNAWGSMITNSGKEGKACSDYKRVVVVPLFNGDIASEPMVLDIPATSLRRPKGYKGTDMMFSEYVTTLAKHEMPVQGAVTNIGFTDAEYPQLCFSFVRFVNESEYATVIKMRQGDDVETVLGASFEAPGPVEKVETPQNEAKDLSKPTETPAPAQGEEVTYPETIVELNSKKLPELKALAKDLEINTNQKKAELKTAIAEELELTNPAPAEEQMSATSINVDDPEADGADSDDDAVMAELNSILNG